MTREAGEMRVLGLVPARGGSKGVPGKNLRPLGGRPLLAWTAEAALGARSLTRVVLSTDDGEIARVGREHGLEAPFLRPPDLASDTAPMLPVVRHALEWFVERGETYDAVCLLQPTSPFRPPALIDRAVALLSESGADAVCTVLPIPPEHHPSWAYLVGDDGRLRLASGEGAPPPRRQDLPPSYHRQGAVYGTRSRVVLEEGSLYGSHLVGLPLEPDDPAARINVDTPEDWDRAEAWAARLGGFSPEEDGP